VGCSVTHQVRPVGAGKLAAEASLGGPFADYFGGYKPLPISTLGLSYGLDDRTDLHAALHPSTTILFGLVGLDLGAGRLLWDQSGARPALMADLTLDLFYGNLGGGDPKGGFRALPELSAMGSWAWGRRGHLLYSGPVVLVQPWPVHAVPAWSLGNQLELGATDLSLEARWISPWVDSSLHTVDWMAPAGQGAISVQLGARYTFGGRGGQE